VQRYRQPAPFAEAITASSEEEALVSARSAVQQSNLEPSHYNMDPRIPA
jgi:hypothetical protein